MSDAAQAGDNNIEHEDFEVLGFDTLLLERVHPNPKNPRPIFHIGPDDPKIMAMADSIKSEGLHNPIKVYELTPEAPGQYVIVQGHRRYEASRLAKKQDINCIIIKRPEDKQRELFWLGSEDAHKLAWSESGLFQMKHAWNLAKELGLPTCARSEISARTGLKMSQLYVADKIFNLEPEIIAMCVAHEKARYEASIGNPPDKRHALHGSKVKIVDFTPERAAQVWDLFVALREQCTLMVREYSDFDLQLKIAAWVTQRGGRESALNLVAALKSNSNRPGTVMQIADLLNNDDKKIADVVRSTRNGAITQLTKTDRSIRSLTATLKALGKKTDQLGGDLQLLKDVERNILELQLTARDFSDKLAQQIRIDSKEQ